VNGDDRNRRLHRRNIERHQHPLAQLAEAGAKRISVGGALSRLALATFINAARAMQQNGSFAWLRDMASVAALGKLFQT
jgi:2-methylisocitrate lyase-like PEP mutase family enzyme